MVGNTKRVLIVFLILFSLILVGCLGFFGYHKYKVSRYNELGDAAITDGNWALARFWYLKTLEVDEKNPDALRELTYYASFFRDPNTLDWWRQYAEVEPESESIQLAFVEILLRNNQIEEAKERLDQINPLPELEARYENILSTYSISVKEFTEAEVHARKAIEISPEDPSLKLNLLNILLHRGDTTTQDEINSLLTELTSEEKNLPKVYRILLGYSIGLKNWEESLDISRKLAQHEDSTWYEKTAYVQLLLRFDSTEIPPFLNQITEPEPKFVEEVCKIFIQSGEPKLMLDWLDQLNEIGVESNLSIEISRSEIYSSMQNWSELLVYLDDKNWDYFDYYRQALLSRAFYSTGKNDLSDQAWLKARKMARDMGLMEPTRLVTIVESWPEFEPRWLEMVEEMMSNQVHTRWAYNKLQSHYFAMGATQELYRVSQRAVKAFPEDAGIENNTIVQALLLNESISDQLVAAKSLYEKHKGKPIPTSTYAFALYKNGMVEEAYNLLMSLDQRYFDIAEIAHYAAVISQAAGHQDEAKIYLEKSKSASLLPEEKALLQN